MKQYDLTRSNGEEGGRVKHQSASPSQNSVQRNVSSGQRDVWRDDGLAGSRLCFT